VSRRHSASRGKSSTMCAPRRPLRARSRLHGASGADPGDRSQRSCSAALHRRHHPQAQPMYAEKPVHLSCWASSIIVHSSNHVGSASALKCAHILGSRLRSLPDRAMMPCPRGPPRWVGCGRHPAHTPGKIAGRSEIAGTVRGSSSPDPPSATRLREGRIPPGKRRFLPSNPIHTTHHRNRPWPSSSPGIVLPEPDEGRGAAQLVLACSMMIRLSTRSRSRFRQLAASPITW